MLHKEREQWHRTAAGRAFDTEILSSTRLGTHEAVVIGCASYRLRRRADPEIKQRS